MIYFLTLFFLAGHPMISSEKNAIFLTDDYTEIDYLYIDGKWYMIDIVERVWPVRYGD